MNLIDIVNKKFLKEKFTTEELWALIKRYGLREMLDTIDESEIDADDSLLWNWHKLVENWRELESELKDG